MSVQWFSIFRYDEKNNMRELCEEIIFRGEKRMELHEMIIVQILLYKTYVRVMNILLASPQGTRLSVVSIGRVSLQFPYTGRHPSGAAI